MKRKYKVAFNDINAAIKNRGWEIAKKLGARQDQHKKGVFHCVNPSHPDKHPSMHIDNHTGLAYCFSCGAGYNMISMARALGHDRRAESIYPRRFSDQPCIANLLLAAATPTIFKKSKIY
jgi:hypothetical protein